MAQSWDNRTVCQRDFEDQSPTFEIGMVSFRKRASSDLEVFQEGPIQPFGVSFPWGDGSIEEWRLSTPGTLDTPPTPPARPGPKRRNPEDVLAHLAEQLARYCAAKHCNPHDCGRAEIAVAAGYTQGSLDNLMIKHGLRNIHVITRALAESATTR